MLHLTMLIFLFDDFMLTGLVLVSLCRYMPTRLQQFNLNQQIMEVQQTWVLPREPIWVHKNQQFIKAVIKQIFKDIITCTLQSGQSIKCKRQDIFHRNPMATEVNRTDLMENDIINQPQILQHLSSRFLSKKIYTYVQNTLIAVNPYFFLPALYTDEVKDSYITTIIKNNDNMKEQEPHLYSITAEMVGRLFRQNADQAIIISGESGAGKTEVNKECLRFLSHYFKHFSSNANLKDSSIEKAILLSNPILQAFGNAKTIRNNNSSRFGKYLSIMVDRNTKCIKHAEIYNYLLQKSRIISRSKEQQNFHVFYQFLLKTSLVEKAKYFLLDVETNSKQLTFQDFAITKNDTQTEYSAHPDISFEKIKQSLTILPNPNSYDYLCRVLASVLHLGNLEPYEDENLDYCEIMPDDSFEIICKLLEVEKKLLFESLTSYNLRIGGQDVIKSFSKREVQELIHSLSKTLYERLFQWIINEINSSTRSKDVETSNLLALGFLDIYGFQVLKTNSLQQLFINYTNQRLHQLYLQKIFKLEKQLFAQEKLQHKFRQVDFQDNMKVIELIDYDKLSIFNLLDDQCGIASPDQTTFITKIRFNHKKHEKFPSSNLNLISTQFLIRHTPQDVNYSVMGFKDKNRDLLREEIKMTMRSSKLKILQGMFTEPKASAESEIDPKAHKVRKFLSSKFRKQMNELILNLLSRSEQHFIRCIKSNGNKKPMEIQQEVVYSQIKYLGILDTIKIKKMGYCVKIKYEAMDRRYKWIVRPRFMVPATDKEIIASVKALLPKFGEEELLFGISKIFFREYAFNVLMKKYSKYLETLNHRAHQITSLFVKLNYMKKKQRKLGHKKTVKKYLQSYLQARRFNFRVKSIIKIQQNISQFLLIRRSAKKMESIQILQAYIKRNIETKARAKKINLIEKVCYRFKSLLLKKRAHAKLAASHIVNKVIIENVFNQLKLKNIKSLSKYLNFFKVKVQRKDKINQVNRNLKNAIEGRSLFAIQNYILGLSAVLNLKHREHQVSMLQNNIRTLLAIRRYDKYHNQVIHIQRAIRQYLFLKKGAKTLFQSTYSSYQQNLKIENEKIQNRLYDCATSKSQRMSAAVKKFLGKFKQKISLMYFIIDFESYVDLDIIYPKESWINNYDEIFQEGLQKNDPLQYLSVGQTFTVAATTTKMYLWGMHDSYKNLQPSAISQIKTKMPVQFFEINKNKLNFSYITDETDKKNDMKHFKICSAVARDYNLENGKLYECLPDQLRLIKDIPSTERVLEISCGKAHTVLRTNAKKVYTFGYGHQGQLGHSSFNSQERPRAIKYFENIKTFNVIQVAASFTSTLVLLSNHKLYWFGKNSTLTEVSTPTLFQLKSKLEIMSSGQFSIARIMTTWSRTMSIIGVTVICYNGKFETNLSLRSKTTSILFSKWQQSNLASINPPLIPSVSDHLEQCHVKLRSKKVNIYPESKQTLKQMQEKVKSISSIASGMFDGNNGPLSGTNRGSIGTEFSFANTQRNFFYK